MYAARTGRSDAGAQFSRIFGVTAGHERRGFFVSCLNEANAILFLTERFNNSVDPIAGYAEDGIHSPFDDCFVHDFRGCNGHAWSVLLALVSCTREIAAGK